MTATAETDLIELWIAAAEDMIERSTNRAIMRQAFRLLVPIVRPQVTLFRPPMEGDINITSAKTVMAGFYTEHGAETLSLGLASMLPTVSFSAINTVDPGSMQVEYETGASDPNEVPAAIRQAVILLASHWYSNREAVNSDPRNRGTDSAIPFGVEWFIKSYRIPNVNIAVNEA